jgi:hypothetical protein
MASSFLLWWWPRVSADDIGISGSDSRDGGGRRLRATEAPEAAGAKPVEQALVEETEEGGGRECSRCLEKLEWNGKNRPPRVERKAQDAWNRGIGETLKRPRSQKKRKNKKRMQKREGRQVSWPDA